MFTWLNKQGVKSDTGFILQRMERFVYHYVENEHVMIIYVEPFTNDKGYFETIDKGSIDNWQPPYDN